MKFLSWSVDANYHLILRKTVAKTFVKVLVQTLKLNQEVFKRFYDKTEEQLVSNGKHKLLALIDLKIDSQNLLFKIYLQNIIANMAN